MFNFPFSIEGFSHWETQLHGEIEILFSISLIGIQGLVIVNVEYEGALNKSFRPKVDRLQPLVS